MKRRVLNVYLNGAAVRKERGGRRSRHFRSSSCDEGEGVAGDDPQVECPFERGGEKGSRAKSVRENSNDSGPRV